MRCTFGGVEEIEEEGGVGDEVFFEGVGVDLFHGVVVGPAADCHCGFLPEAEVAGQGGEGVAQAVGSYIGNAGTGGGFPIVAADGALGDGDHIVALLLGDGEGIAQGLDDGDSAAGTGVFGSLLTGELAVFVPDGGFPDVEDTGIQIHGIPAKTQDLGLPQRGECQQGGDQSAVVGQGIQEGLDLAGLEEALGIVNLLGECGLRSVAGGFGHDTGHEHPGVFQSLRGAETGFPVDDALPLIGLDVSQDQGHGGLESLVLDPAVSGDGGGGQNILTPFDVAVDGLCEGHGTGAAPACLLAASLQRHVFSQAGFLRGLGDGVGCAVDFDA